MSHFTVLVVGDDIERQLAPYHEFECTGVDDEFVVDVDITSEILAMVEKGDTLNDALEYHGLTNRTVADESAIDRLKLHKYGYAVINPNSTLKRAVRRTNQNAKWDWYQVGGRWSGYFRLKEGKDGELGEPGVFDNKPDAGCADSALKGDIDFEFMRSEAGLKAGEMHDSIHSVIAGREFKLWPDLRDEFKAAGKTIEEARSAYHAQPVVVDINKWIRDNQHFPLMDIEPLIKKTRERYVREAMDSAIATFAFIKDGKWIERGEMGGFACVSNEKDEAAWNREFAEMLDKLPDDTRLTVVDCHI